MSGDAVHAAWASRLESLGLAVRSRLIAARDAGQDMATPVAQEGGDTIFAIDRHVESVLEEHAQQWANECGPLVLIAEGMGEDGRHAFKPANTKRESTPGVRVLIDPIDGTRNIMYDKRAAWFIASATDDRGVATTLADAFASAIVELPTSKAGYADSFTATRGSAAQGRRSALQIDNGKSTNVNLTLRPSGATTLKNGFAQVANFFPGTKVLASELMERIAAATLGQVRTGQADVFDDQYISTAGQMVELMTGHDRFVADLRPLFYRVLSKQTGREIRGLECHPYDVSGSLVAQRAGVVITDGFGGPLTPPLDVHTGVHWCGYANEALRKQIEPVIKRFFVERGVTAP